METGHHIKIIILLSSCRHIFCSISNFAANTRHHGFKSHFPHLYYQPAIITSPLVSILEAVLTVSPNKQYRGILIPTTPATVVPLCMPGQWRVPIQYIYKSCQCLVSFQILKNSIYHPPPLSLSLSLFYRVLKKFSMASYMRLST